MHSFYDIHGLLTHNCNEITEAYGMYIYMDKS